MDRRGFLGSLGSLATPLVVQSLLGGRGSAAEDVPPAWPIKASDDGRFLADARGEPFFYHADTAWVLPKKLTLHEAEEYLDRRKSDGFTAVHLHAVSKECGPTTNRDGQEPFRPAGDILKPNEPYWEHLDDVLAAARRRGLLVALSPIWLSGWRKELTAEKARGYGRFLGGRYKSFDNILWILGGDANPDGSLRAINELTSGIRDAAPGLPMTAHNAAEHPSTRFFDDQEWLTIDFAYTYREVHGQVLDEWSRSGRERPIVLGESGYENESNDGRGGSPWRVRRQAYAAVLSGALGGHAYRNRGIWTCSDWRRALDDPGSKQMRHVKDLFAARAWYRLVPDVESRLVAEGRGKVGEMEFVSAAATADGHLAIAYLPTSRPVAIDLVRLEGPIRARWYDPTSGEDRAVAAKPIDAQGRRDFNPPGRNRGGDHDWILLLEGPEK